MNTNVGETNAMKTVTQLEVTDGGSAKSAQKASGTNDATYTYTGAGSGLTFQTRGTIGALKSVELVNEGTAAATTATYTVPGGSGKIGWAAIGGVPTGVSMKNEAAARGDLSLTPSANILTNVVVAANHSVSHPSFHLPAATYRMGVVKTFSLIGAGEGADAKTAAATGGNGTGATFTTTLRSGVPKRSCTRTEVMLLWPQTILFHWGQGTELVEILVEQNVISHLSNDALTTTTLGDFPSSTTSRQATRVGGGDDIYIQYDVKVGEITEASAIPTHAGQTALEATTDKPISKSYRLTNAGSGYTVSANAVALGALEIEVTQIGGSGEIERFRILKDAAVGTYTDNTASIDIVASNARGANVPTVTSSRVDGVIKTATFLTQAGSNYVSSGSMGLTSIQSDGQTANPGSNATFGVTGFGVKQSTYNGDGAFEIVGDASGLSQAMKAELAALTGAYTFYQVHPTLYSRSAYPNTVGKNYNGFSIARRTIYVDGNSERTSSRRVHSRFLARVVPRTLSRSPLSTVAQHH